MALPLAIPLAAPLAPAVAAEAAAVGTLVLGSGAYLAEQAYGFRRGLPPIPRVGGRAGGATLQELLKDAVAGARVGVGSLFPEPWKPPFWAAAAGVVFAKAADFLSQLWGRINSNKPTTYIPTPGGSVTVAKPVQGT